MKRTTERSPFAAALAAFGATFAAAALALGSNAPSAAAAQSADAAEGETEALARIDFGASAAPSPGPDTRGFFVEFLGNSNHVEEPEDAETAEDGAVVVGENGPGGTLLLAYGFTPSFAGRLSISGAEHTTTDPDIDVQFSSVTIEGAYIFRAGTSVRPYLYGGVGAFSVASDQEAFDFETTGPGIDMGVGLYSFLGDHFVFDAALRFDFINWETQTATRRLENGDELIVETPVDEEGGAAKILLGVGWWF